MTDRADRLRAAFDRAFAAAPAPAAAASIEVLRIRVGGEPYVIALAELAGLHADLHVVPLPSAATELLGVVAVRNAIVPVYDLRALLGAGRAPPSRWLVVARGTPALAFAFEGFDGHARIAELRGAASIDGRLHQVIELASIRTSMRTRWDRKV